MTVWNGEEDGYVTADRDTWVDEKQSRKKQTDPYAYVRDVAMTEDEVRGTVEALRYAGWKVNRKCYPTDVGDELIAEADAIQAEWERRQHED